MTPTNDGAVRLERVVALAAALFGVVTIFAAATVLSGLDRGLAGSTVTFVLWTNFALGAAYVVAAVLLWRGSHFARPLAFGIAAVTALAGAGYTVVAIAGAPVERRTAIALGLRIAFWLGVAVLAPRNPRKR